MRHGNLGFIFEKFTEMSCGNLAFIFFIQIAFFQGGQHVLGLVDFFGGSFIIFALTTLEVFAVCWVYGKGTSINDVTVSVGRGNQVFCLVTTECYNGLKPYSKNL